MLSFAPGLVELTASVKIVDRICRPKAYAHLIWIVNGEVNNWRFVRIAAHSRSNCASAENQFSRTDYALCHSALYASNDLQALSSSVQSRPPLIHASTLFHKTLCLFFYSNSFSTLTSEAR